jgi:oligosaccharide repeat unit polymerase
MVNSMINQDSKKIGNFLVITTFLAIGIFVFCVTFTGILENLRLGFLWNAVYLVSILLIFMRVKRGLFYDPLALLTSSYLFFIVLGALLFQEIKGRTYWFYPTNLIGIGYIFLILGVIVFQKYRLVLSSRVMREVEYEPHQMKNRSILWVFVSICMIATVLLFVSAGQIPLLARDVNAAKLYLVSGRGHIRIFFVGLQVMSLALVYDAAVRMKKRKMIQSHFVGVFIVVVLAAMANRSGMLTFIGEYFGIYYFLSKRTPSLKKLAIVAVLMVIFIGLMGAYRHRYLIKTSLASQLLQTVVARPKNFETIVSVYNESRRSYGVRYFQSFEKLLPGSQSGPGVELREQLMPNQEHMAELSGISVSIVGESYINFGKYGVPIMMLFIGIVASALYYKMVNRPSFIICVLYFTLIFNMVGAFLSGIGSKMFQLSMLWSWLFLVGFLYEKRIRWG